jgi:hypothetical protein
LIEQNKENPRGELTGSNILGAGSTLSHPLIFEMTWVGKDDSAYPVP